MLTQNFHTMIASMLKGEKGVPGTLYIAVGEGHREWDTLPPHSQRGVPELAREIARKRVAAGDMIFLAEDGSPSLYPTSRLSVTVRFRNDEAIGSLRECGLFGGEATDASKSGLLLSYHIHPLIEKTTAMELRRSLRLDLTPSEIAAGSRVTRYLGNVRTEEIHDLESINPNCQIGEIRSDYRHYFLTLEQGMALGYDRCAYCFGRRLSAH